ncbi:MAG: aminotransferase [Panacagrimonas sp.]|nr:DegT/DnrJ/EryC1/StrS family aminotransferase [Panacagrimonas sp.]MCC2657158.1 aminotransferase [Panacagrimonas sp.]
MNVPFLDLHAATRELRPEMDEAIGRVLDSGRFVLGAEVEAFESEFAAYVGAAHAVGVGSGLDALHLGLRALGIGPGDEVIVPSHTFIATWLAVTHCGACPVPVEVDLRTALLDPQRVEDAIGPRTRAMLPVHLYGHPAALEALYDIADRRGLAVLEDAAQAHGARYRGRRIGGHGRLAAWSFYPGKNLGALGDAGAITTDDPELLRRLQRLRNYGSAEKYVHETIGFNSRLDPLQAAVLRVRLRHLDAWNQRRSAIAAYYLEALSGTGLTLPVCMPDCEPAWHLFVVRSAQRDRLADGLRARGVETLIHYPIAPHQQTAYADRSIPSQPIAERLAREVLSLPLGPHLDRTQAEQVIASIREVH